MSLRTSIPSMFHRRLLLLGGVILMLFFILFVQLTRLTVVEGAEHLEDASRVLSRRTFLPTVRGSIFDRHGRTLAVDHAGYNVAVRYDVITGAWAMNRAMEAASKSDRQWRERPLEERHRLAAPFLKEFEDQEADIWETIVLDGNITWEDLDRRRNLIKRRVHRQAAAVRDEARRVASERYDDGAATFVSTPILEETVAHVVLDDVDDIVAFQFMELAERYEGLVEVYDTGHREYPWSSARVEVDRTELPRDIRSKNSLVIDVHGVADHLLGSVRDRVWAEDIARRPFLDPRTNAVKDLGGYRQGDVVGNRGLERRYEDMLRGTRGVVMERQDTGARNRIDPVPGQDIQLTLDIVLQQKVQAILSPQLGLTRVQPWHGTTKLPRGTELNAAAVVLEVETGEIMAMVTMPTNAMADEMTELAQNIRKPWYNRALETSVVPGSIIKPLTLIAGLEEEVLGLDETISCAGHYFPNTRDAYRCWIYRDRFGLASHGPLAASEAIGRSCNIFFYTLGDKLGIDRLYDWYRFFGMGEVLDVGVVTRTDTGRALGESAGLLMSDEQLAKIDPGSFRSEAIFNAIGQGRIEWTPMHAANAYATLARGGTIRDATLLIERPDATRVPRTADRPIDPAFRSAALEGLRQSVEEIYGTGHHIRYSSATDWDALITATGVRVWAKTGTAQAPPLLLDENGNGTTDDGELKIRDLDHSWWVGLIGPEGTDTPLYAIAVLVEYGGSGGRVSGPIASEIIRALQGEGYLPEGRD